MFTVGFLGRARLGLDVLEGLLANPEIHVPVIISCGATPEVEDTAARMQALADARGIDYFTTNQINKPEWEERLAGYSLDLAVAMLWLHTINDRIIATARHGFINCHGGHLPKYRGNACANWAILTGEPFIGTTAHLMAPGALDNGPVILQDRVKIGPDAYIGDLIGELEEKGKRLVLQSVEAFRTGTAVLAPQDEGQASYCYPRIPRDGEIDWTEPAEMVRRLVRAASRPYPGAYSWYQDHRGGGAIRKLTLWRARVERHPLNEYYAVPGHVLRLDGGAKWGVVCGDKQLLVLEEVEIDGQPADAHTLFKTVRQRLGLDHSGLAAAADRRLAALESLGATAARFTGALASELDTIEAEVDRTIDAAVEQLDGTVPVTANPLRNYSFQKRWFDWEKRERWFGVQVYRSLRLTAVADEPFAIGIWRFSNEAGEIENRVYVAVKEEYAATYGANAEAAFRAVLEGEAKVARTAAGELQGIYGLTDAGPEQAAALIAALALRLAGQ